MYCCNDGGRCCGPIQTTGRTARTPLYITGFVLLFATTVLVLIALSTNNWQITSLATRKATYYTSGLWFNCKNVQISWYNNRIDSFCKAYSSTAEGWLISCEVLYTIGAFIIVCAFFLTLLGFCTDIGNYTAAIPSLIQWLLVASTVLQIITVSVYGSKGIGDYKLFEPDYSLIIAAIATALTGICMTLFILETECAGTKRAQQGYTTQ